MGWGIALSLAPGSRRIGVSASGPRVLVPLTQPITRLEPAAPTGFGTPAAPRRAAVPLPPRCVSIEQ
jgi:hypothetical protein